MSRTPRRKNPLLLIAGRLQGVPQISFDVEPVGTVTSNTESADVSDAMHPTGWKRMVSFKLIRQPTPQAVSLADIDRGIATAANMATEDVDAFDRVVGDGVERV
jgi:hypothetical protein